MEVQTATQPHILFDQKTSEAQVGVQNTGDLSLRTREGDLVNLSFGNEFQFAQSQQETVENGVVTQEISTVAQAAARYSLSVEGDLNEDELAAIDALAKGIQPIAEEFFLNGEFNFDEASETLRASLGEIQEVELRLERTIAATFAFQQTQLTGPSGEGGGEGEVVPEIDPAALNELGTSDGFLNFPNVRDITQLVLSVIETEFPEKGLEVFGSKALVRSLREFLDVLRDRVTVSLNGAKPVDGSEPTTVESAGTPQSNVQDFIEV
ncbi:MAG: hypothetical protein G3M70_09770 [Candidatus Nitronauta litoralis]|uniref:DUF5610 domain-containing protein n=1 Tax=Candidatus Nitronauta litoralis TaxID=2705533 RepID=A0A7T0BWB6_9BACT|nr:MAG: hypothetical protein G3M70_09770 [Candidatus Nitronauta litoralis]